MGIFIFCLIGAVITCVAIERAKKAMVNGFLLDILVSTSFALFGSINGYSSALMILEKGRGMFTILFTILCACIVFSWLSFKVGIFEDEQFRTFEIVIFILVFIIASGYWVKFFINYENNIEKINETIVVDEQKYQLLYFCNIPVQQVSGSISGDVSGSVLWVDGEISGSISTLEELPYWYLNENGEGEYNSVSTNSSNIRFIEASEKTYVEVITYRNQTRTVNHNNSKETKVIGNEWQEYIFYLPQAIMQYPLE